MCYRLGEFDLNHLAATRAHRWRRLAWATATLFDTKLHIPHDYRILRKGAL